MENTALLERFEQLMKEQDHRELKAFLDDQLITDIAELIYELPDDAVEIINHLTLSRAAAANPHPTSRGCAVDRAAHPLPLKS